MIEQSNYEPVSRLAEQADTRFLTVKQFSQIYPWPSESALRAYIYRASDMGLSDAFLRVGRRVLVAPSRFFVLIKGVEKKSAQIGCIYEKGS